MNNIFYQLICHQLIPKNFVNIYIQLFINNKKELKNLKKLFIQIFNNDSKFLIFFFSSIMYGFQIYNCEIINKIFFTLFSISL